MTNYQTGVLENSAKMVLLFHLIDDSVSRGDKILVFRWEIYVRVTVCSCLPFYLESLLQHPELSVMLLFYGYVNAYTGSFICV